MRDELRDRFMAKVDRSGGEDGCWHWLASTFNGGYGQFRSHELSTALAHRISYEHFIGAIEQDFQIDHLCRNRACVNPKHLEAVTSQENCARSSSADHCRRLNAAMRSRPFCKSGHERTPDNVYLYQDPNGELKQFCRECRRAFGRKWYHDRKAH